MLEKRVVLDQIELQVRDYECKADAIIFLHFSSANLMMWQRAVPFFQDQYRLILVDLRGHGKSSKPETGYHMDSMACDIADIMPHLGLEQAHIVGSSLGAEVGLSLAANYPEKVLSLVCDGALSSEYGPYSSWEGTETEFQEHVASHLEKMRSAPEKIYPSVDALVNANREMLEKYGYWNEYIEAMERYGTYQVGEGQYTKSFRKSARIDYMQNYFQYRLENSYAKVSCPLLMLAGGDVLENEREKSAMIGLKNLAKRAEVAEISEWDHPYGWLLEPEPACKAILNFLSQI